MVAVTGRFSETYVRRDVRGKEVWMSVNISHQEQNEGINIPIMASIMLANVTYRLKRYKNRPNDHGDRQIYWICERT